VIAAALALILVSIALVRVGWGGILTALTLLAATAGAWGIAIGVTAGIAAALMIVLWAGWKTPGKPGRPLRERPSVTMPHQWSDTTRRFGVFVLAVPVSFAAAQWLAFGIQAILRHAGAGAADADVTMLFLSPVLWTLLLSWQMTQVRLIEMVIPLVMAGLLGTLLWGSA
jgi:hypothetical protein